MNPTRQRVIEMIENRFFHDRPFDLDDEDSFLEEGVIDSLGMIELVSMIEANFGVKVADEELSPDNLDSVRALTEYLVRKGDGTR